MPFRCRLSRLSRACPSFCCCICGLYWLASECISAVSMISSRIGSGCDYRPNPNQLCARHTRFRCPLRRRRCPISSIRCSSGVLAGRPRSLIVEGSVCSSSVHWSLHGRFPVHSPHVVLLRYVSRTVSRKQIFVGAYHVVYSTEHSPAALPLAIDLRIMFCLMPYPVFLAREAAGRGLRTTGDPTT